jgi:AGCS family alanine or glycine:cation symporter
MSVNDFFDWLNNNILDYPAVILFFGASIILTFKTGFVQLRGWPRFFKLIIHGVAESQDDKKDTINPFHALFTAMATTIGMGNVVTPSLAIMVGGPGALFWLLFYMFFGSVTKYAEVSFALATRKALPDGFILGGPIQYLRSVSTAFANWYGYLIIIVLVSWSGAQSNTLANILALEGVDHWMVGLSLALFVLIALSGGARRVGEFASRLVPIMFVLYVIFAFSILLRNPEAVMIAIKQMFRAAFTPSAAVGGFFGASVFRAVREGMFRGIFISEAGIGTSSIPHALADTKIPSDQGVLAMGSMLADAFLSALSGILVLMTGIWQIGAFRSTLLYEVFKLNAPGIGQYVLLLSIILFVLTTVMGNSFNGVQSFGILVKDNRILMRSYITFVVVFIFIGALMPMRLLWTAMDTLVMIVSVPNLIGLLILAFRRGEVLKLR